MEEIWKPVIGFEQWYEVSNLGRVKSLDRVYGHNLSSSGQLRKSKLLKLAMESNGYLQVKLNIPSQKAFLAHRIVAQAFVPNPDNKSFVNHINGIKHDNRADNLEWVTKSENAIHSFKIGLQCNKGEKHPSHKLTNTQVKRIRKSKKSSRILADQYSVSKTTIKDIKNFKIWTHI